MKSVDLRQDFDKWRKRFVSKNMFIIYFIACSLLSSYGYTMSVFNNAPDEWKIRFYTGGKIWSGTDSVINVQIHGTHGKLLCL